MGSFKYFAYGSNLSARRLLRRTASARAAFAASLPGYKLTFDKKSKDKSGKADCLRTDNPTDVVHGGIFEILDCELDALDLAEGSGNGYHRTSLRVYANDSEYDVVTYLATTKDPSLHPYDWYLLHVLIGAQEFRLPPPYIAKLNELHCQFDGDISRSKKETSIYSDDEISQFMMDRHLKNHGS